MDQSPSWEANSHSSGEDNLRLMWNPKVLYYAHKIFWLNHIQSYSDLMFTVILDVMTCRLVEGYQIHWGISRSEKWLHVTRRHFRPNTAVDWTPLSTVVSYSLHEEGSPSGKSRSTWNVCNIRTVSKTRPALRISVAIIRSVMDLLIMKYCVYSTSLNVTRGIW
jgi:hypothetical protein